MENKEKKYKTNLWTIPQGVLVLWKWHPKWFVRLVRSSVQTLIEFPFYLLLFMRVFLLMSTREKNQEPMYKYVFWRPKQSTAKNSYKMFIIFEGMLWRCRIIQTKTDSFATNYSYLCTSMQNLSFLHGLVLELWACELWQKKSVNKMGTSLPQ